MVLPALAAVLFVVVVGYILGPAAQPGPPRCRAGNFSRTIATDGQGGAL
jgi:hypothetical protein